ncbi:Eisosomes component [Cladophialophora chaetospira]|uniref:Eisosomes component n=1 Tax=Cladophialophora chaetospira TaxID=386627 RepID=A0AA38X7Q6_9EURO|nr:Eisosomes component [Cladophialophora chaetospira]
MAARNGIFGLASLILVAAGLLFMFFIVLAGAIDKSPISKFYFLEANTGRIPGAPPVSRWTYWNICNGAGGSNRCPSVHPAFPLDPSSHRNFGTRQGVPRNFVEHHGYYFLMTRFMFAFMLMALFFGVMALFTGLLALCTRLGSYLSSLMTMLAAFFQAINAGLMTAAYVKGRDNFRGNGQPAHIGKYAFGFEWAAFACFVLSTVLFCLGGGKRKESKASGGKKGFGFGRGRFGGKRSRSTRSRGSFVQDKEYGA